MSKKVFPTNKELREATLKVMGVLGTSADTTEINKKVAELLDLDDEILKIEDSSGCGTKYMVRMRWCRTELKKEKLIENEGKGIWKLK